VTDAVRTYAVECFSPAIDRLTVERSGDRAIAAAAEVRNGGRWIEYAGAILFPEDEVVFHLFSASSAAAVRDASRVAGVEFERVLESIPIGMGPLAGARI
jgi:hypothetical protein